MAVLVVIAALQIEAQLGSAEAVLRVVAAAVLAAGSKSCTHVNVLLERYSHLLQQQMQALGQEQGQEVLLDVLGHMYSQMPTRLHIALSRYAARNSVLCCGAYSGRGILPAQPVRWLHGWLTPYVQAEALCSGGAVLHSLSAAHQPMLCHTTHHSNTPWCCLLCVLQANGA